MNVEFFFGLFAGFILGVFVMCLMAMARSSDDDGQP